MLAEDRTKGGLLMGDREGVPLRGSSYMMGKQLMTTLNEIILITLFIKFTPVDKHVIKVAREGCVVICTVGGASDREKMGAYSTRSTPYEMDNKNEAERS